MKCWTSWNKPAAVSICALSVTKAQNVAVGLLKCQPVYNFNEPRYQSRNGKLSLCLTKHGAMKTYWGSWDISPHTLNLGTWCRWVACFRPRGKSPRYPSQEEKQYDLLSALRTAVTDRRKLKAIRTCAKLISWQFKRIPSNHTAHIFFPSFLPSLAPQPS